MLDEVAEALCERLSRVVVSGPLSKIIEALDDVRMNAEELAAQLIKLDTDMTAPRFSGLAGRFPTDSMLEIYFQSLKRNEQEARMFDLQRQKLMAADKVLRELSDSPEQRLVRIMLEHIHLAFGCEL